MYKVEIVIVDAGSGDRTVEISKPLADTVHRDDSLAGAKYKSLNAGAERARGEVLFFLDADCLVPQDFDAHIISALRLPDVVGGAFEFKMDNRTWSYRMIELINRVRYRVTQNYFGDQGLFCNRLTFENAGGYPERPIMEAAYFCQILRKTGKLKLIKSAVVSSVRRFEQGGKWAVLFRDFIIWLRFLLKMDVSQYARSYWAVNKKGND